jgi:hypothetical protein
MITDVKYLKAQQEYVKDNLKEFTDSALLDMFPMCHKAYETALSLVYYDDIPKEAIDVLQETYHIVRNELLRRMSK